MRRVFLAAACGATLCAAAGPNIWPLPKTYTSGTAAVAVDATKFAFASSSPASDELQAAFARYREQYFPNRVPAVAAGMAAVTTVTVTVDDDTADLQLGVDESYTLKVAEDGTASIAAKTQFGAYHAMETLGQLIVFSAKDKAFSVKGAPWEINDAPRFAHREVLLDTSRHFHSLASLKNIIQSFTYAKVNTVHWHIVDQQSFPWVAPSAPEMAKGAYSDDEQYTQEDVEDIIAFARARGIRVVMEIDTPGHAASWCAGHPEICPAADCQMPLRPDTNKTFEVIEGLVRDLAKVAPDAYFHIGGDEVNTNCWSKSADVKAWMDAQGFDEHAAYLYFVQRVTAIVQGLGKHVVGWDELWANFGESLDKKTIIYQWRPWADATSAATAAGYNVLWSNDGPWYLDGLATTWQKMYEAEPCNGLSDAQCALVLGGGGEMWGETVDASDIQATIWPRMGAVAERLWSPREATASSADAEDRYAWFRCYLNRKGVGAAPHANAQARQAPPGPGGCYAQ